MNLAEEYELSFRSASRRTLVLLNGEWAMVKKKFNKVPNVQVSDTTGDAMKNKSL